MTQSLLSRISSKSPRPAGQVVPLVQLSWHLSSIVATVSRYFIRCAIPDWAKIEPRHCRSLGGTRSYGDQSGASPQRSPRISFEGRSPEILHDFRITSKPSL